MVAKADVLKYLPRFMNHKKMLVWEQNTDDIYKEIEKSHELFSFDYDLIAGLFDTGDIYQTCKELWEFCKYNLTYNMESGDEQSSKSPSAILKEGQKIDCKHYSLFIAGVLDAIQRHEPQAWNWCYRFASYNAKGEIEHVFVVVFNRDKEIWIDPVLRSFNERKSMTYYKDVKPMALVRISGVGGPNNPEIEVDAKKAESDFLVALNLNLYQARDLFKRNPSVVNGPVRDWYAQNGLDFNQLLLILNNNLNG